MEPVAGRMAPFVTYQEFHGARIFPVVARTTLLGSFLLLGFFYLDWVDTGGRDPWGWLVALRLAALALTLAAGWAAHAAPGPREKLAGVMVGGFGAQTVLTATLVTLSPHLLFLPYILTFYFLSFVQVAPLLTFRHTLGFLAGVWVTVGLSLDLSYRLGGPVTADWYPALLQFVVPCLAFVAILASSLRRGAEETYALARQDHLRLSFDSLSQVLNRASWAARAGARWGRCRDAGTPCAVLMVDIDHFKAVNDTLGHDAGDRVIQAVARVLVDQVRDDDLVGRWGGEEFVVLLPGADGPTAGTIAERIRAAVEGHASEGSRNVTVSIGVAGGVPPAATLEVTLQDADRGLYRAKAGGRNRVVTVHAAEPAD